jgi:hypothetical protein
MDNGIDRIGPSKTDLWSGISRRMQIRRFEPRFGELLPRLNDLGMKRGQVLFDEC